MPLTKALKSNTVLLMSSMLSKLTSKSQMVPKLGPVGRLDKASEGLLLLTNDSEWAAKITSQRVIWTRNITCRWDYVADADLLARVIRGCTVEDAAVGAPAQSGEHLHAKGAKLLRHGDKNSWLAITLDEGKNRQIRRLLEALEVRVLRLVRVSVGPVEFGDLKKGFTRKLTPDEKRALDRELQGIRS